MTPHHQYSTHPWNLPSLRMISPTPSNENHSPLLSWIYPLYLIIVVFTKTINILHLLLLFHILPHIWGNQPTHSTNNFRVLISHNITNPHLSNSIKLLKSFKTFLCIQSKKILWAYKLNESIRSLTARKYHTTILSQTYRI